MDLEAKNSQLLKITPETNCGFLPYEGETLNSSRRADKKEAYNVKRSNLTEGCPPVFVDASAELWVTLGEFGRRFCVACSLALGLPMDYFSKTMTERDMCTLRSRIPPHHHLLLWSHHAAASIFARVALLQMCPSTVIYFPLSVSLTCIWKSPRRRFLHYPPCSFRPTSESGKKMHGLRVGEVCITAHSFTKHRIHNDRKQQLQQT